MKVIYLIVLFSVCNFVALGQDNAVKFDRTAYYSAMSSDKLTQIDEMLKKLDRVSFDLKDAFVGALLMKKAGLISGLSNKLSTFKEGNKKLESEIKKNTANGELRFLRLMIQENAPGILNYSDKKTEDKQIILKCYKSMPGAVQKAIIEYTKQSKVLHASDFN